MVRVAAATAWRKWRTACVAALALSAAGLCCLILAPSHLATYYSRLNARQPSNISIVTLRHEAFPEGMSDDAIIEDLFQAARAIRTGNGRGYGNHVVLFPLEVKLRGEGACFEKVVLALEEARKHRLLAEPKEFQVDFERGVKIWHAFLVVTIRGKKYYVDPVNEIYCDALKSFVRRFYLRVALNDDVFDVLPVFGTIYAFERRTFPNVWDTLTFDQRAFAALRAKPETQIKLDYLWTKSKATGEGKRP